MKNALAVVLVLSAASVALSQYPIVHFPIGEYQIGEDVVVSTNPFGTDRTHRWEYKVEERAGKNPGIVAKRLNAMAQEGWELSQIDTPEGLYIFRRPAEELPVELTARRRFHMERERAIRDVQDPVGIPKER